MKCSANEVMTLAAKAARGGGAPPAQASDFGGAALCHLIAGRDPGALDAALDVLPEGPILALPLALTVILEEGTPSQARGAMARGAFPSLILSYLDMQPFETLASQQGQAFDVTLSPTRPRARPVVARVDVPDVLAAKMHALAARLLVPESDASRLSGAGAGLTDND